MRRLILALALPLLFLGCASQPPKALHGSYAVVLDPAFTPQKSAQVSPLLHQRVYRGLQHRLPLAASAAEADTVIVLEPSDKPGHVRYQIRRGDRTVTSYAQIGPIAKSTRLSVADEVQLQRQNERRKADIDRQSSDDLILNRRNNLHMDHDLHRALGPVAGRIIQQIVRDLQELDHA